MYPSIFLITIYPGQGDWQPRVYPRKHWEQGGGHPEWDTSPVQYIDKKQQVP